MQQRQEAKKNLNNFEYYYYEYLQEKIRGFLIFLDIC